MKKWKKPGLLTVALMVMLALMILLPLGTAKTFAADRIHVYVDTLAELRAACAVDGNYVELSGSITTDVEGFLVDITGNEVTLDLGNYKLENTSPLGEFFDSGVVRIQSADVSVLSGTLAGGNRFSYGVYIDKSAGDARLEHLRIKEKTGTVGCAIYAGAEKESTVRVRDCQFTQMAGQPDAKRRYFVNVRGKTKMIMEDVTLDAYDANPDTGTMEQLLGVFSPASVRLADVTMKKPLSGMLMVVWAEDYLSIGDVAANPDVIVTADGISHSQGESMQTAGTSYTGDKISHLTCRELVFKQGRVETIDTAALELTAPAVGKRPDYDPVCGDPTYYAPLYNAYRTINFTTWTDLTTDSEMHPDRDKFQVGHKYQVEIQLASEAGYKFNDATTATVNGKTAAAELVTRLGRLELNVKYTFPSIPATSIASAKIKAIPDQKYTGSAIKPALTVTLDGKTLKAGTDYTASYQNNINPGTATVTVTGKGDYSGTLKATFKIVKPAVKPTFERFFGKDRYATSIAVAEEYRKALGISKFNYVCVADGQNFPDALAGAYFAAQKKAPILVVHQAAPTGDKSMAVINYIKKNLPAGKTVYILGGPGSVPDVVVTTLTKAGYKVQRLWGQNRYGSNLSILKAANVKAGTDFIVCTGTQFADALSASATEKPVLLVAGNKLTADQKAYLKAVKAKSFTIVGTKTNVVPAIETELKALAPTTRLAGATIYDRSIQIGKKFFPLTVSHINLADGRNFPDALCGGPLAVKKGGPLLLTDGSNAVNSKIRTYAKAAKATKATVYGGPASVSDATVKFILSIN
ncbi:MAG: cell wall-binding repeat-containing protein [Clostridia bacterium]|nr:cell wall-binding repeat-containing protein [Clostridia bacterium]